MTASPVDFGDIQGLVRFGYRDLKDACFFLLRIRDATMARAWLAAAPIASAEKLSRLPETALHVAFAPEGLRTLGLSEATLAGFSPEFLDGMAGQESRSRRLGDIGANSPENWRWGGPGNAPHLLAMLYALPGRLEAWTNAIKAAPWDSAFEVLDCLTTTNLDGFEPFGFQDGISQPTPDWERERDPAADQLEYGNLVSLGEFLLGYPNEYGKYTHRPLLAASELAAASLPFAEDFPGKRDLGRNGTYLVFRQLRQDVRGFWRFLEEQANANQDARLALAEAMVGRAKKGDPLLPPSKQPIAGIDPKSVAQNQFVYDSDADGARCPFGAHIRRTNPRNADLPPGSQGLLTRLLRTLGFDNKHFRDDAIASTRFHRLLRRGREYGQALSPEQAIADGPDSGERGIHFICLAANILRQFEFVQNSWVMGTKFNGLTGESDPLLGNREPVGGCPASADFSTTRESGVRTRIAGLPQFVTVRGGAYFFLPSLGALRYLVSVGLDGAEK